MLDNRTRRGVHAQTSRLWLLPLFRDDTAHYPMLDVNDRKVSDTSAKERTPYCASERLQIAGLDGALAFTKRNGQRALRRLEFNSSCGQSRGSPPGVQDFHFPCSRLRCVGSYPCCAHREWSGPSLSWTPRPGSPRRSCTGSVQWARSV